MKKKKTKANGSNGSNGRGRPPKKLQQRLAERVIDYGLITRLSEKGLTDKEIAHVLGLKREATIHEWKREDAEFAVALKKGKEVSDREVIKALYKRAIGYEYEEIHSEIEDVLNKQGASTGFRNRSVKRLKKQMAPDPTSCIFWLKNRLPEDWRDRQEFVGDPSKPLTFKVVYESGPRKPKA